MGLLEFPFPVIINQLILISIPSSLSYLILIYLSISFEKLPFGVTVDDTRLPETLFETFNFSFINLQISLLSIKEYNVLP